MGFLIVNNAGLRTSALYRGYNGLFPSVHREESTMPLCSGHHAMSLSFRSTPRIHPDIDERQFRVDGGAIKNIYQTTRRRADPCLCALIRLFIVTQLIARLGH